MHHDPALLRTLRKKAMSLPLRPGVYIMKNKNSEIIYIGKAKALKNRVSQYFGSQEKHNQKVLKMVENVADFDYIVCDSEYEALVLECNLIKLHTPKYNILLKDDKGYHYIKITNEDFPKISAVKQLADDGARYIGPYTSSFAVNQSVDEANKIFLLPTCTKHLTGKPLPGRACLNHSIKQCMAPCRGNISSKEYKSIIAEAIDFLQGGSGESIKKLTERMNECAENLEFEKAARLRDRINALQKMRDRQKVVRSNIPEQDIFAIACGDGDCCCIVFRFLGGRLVDSEQYMLGEISSRPYARAQLLLQFYSLRDRIPPKIYLDGEVEDQELLEQLLSEQRGKSVSISIPQRGEQRQLVEMCHQNALEHLSNPKGRLGANTGPVEELGRLLGLSKAPQYIESYDISHTAGEANVAGMVVFENGLPKKSAYRRFSIKTVSGADDYASLREVITRRLVEYSKNKESGEGFGRLPDLILLDGGSGQVSAVMPIIKKSGYDIPLFGMVKDDKHRTRAISAEGGEISITSSRSAFTLVSSIQEEVHRFAISYHRSKRSQAMKGSSLTKIEGIGETRAKALLKSFRTISAIKEASVDELASVEGMTLRTAQSVYDYYHSEDNL